MEFSAEQIATMLNGKIEGDELQLVRSLSKIEEGKPGSLTFLANPKYSEHLYTTQASVVIIGSDFVLDRPVPKACTLIRVDDAYGAFATLLEAYNAATKPQPGISKTASISDSAEIGKNVHIGDFVVIGNHVKIGDDSIIESGVSIADRCTIGSHAHFFSGVRIYRDTQIGTHCTIHANTVVGADGFGFAPSNSDGYKKVPQIGNVIIEDHVDIGANSCIDRATLGSTIIRKGVKLDNLVQIAHNVEIGEHTVIAAQSGVAGSTKLGANCMIGGQVGFAGHLSIADGTKIAAQSGLGANIKEPNTIVQGSPAFPIGDYKRSYVLFRGLPQMRQQIQALDKKISELFENLTHE